ncbi:asparaginase [Lampropedia puyangensis]|uniref:Asparaginase n=1 Tax=Lampropedia puyangensis TaxID=1330072 RepID=A0A4S8F3N1_9BURK|nr:asparaginase [Lampropedia puyangensis]THU01045.1 asparaginase [Lampropedia puyangensis]
METAPMPHPSSTANPANVGDPTIRILATGGTIAGTAHAAHDNVSYQAAALPIDALLDGVPALRQLPARIQAQQILSKDSKDLDPADWLVIARATHAALVDPDVAGIVITHGTDTLEETAWFLHRTLPHCEKPVVLVSAMRPATALGADGPQNLWDACCVALAGIHQSVDQQSATIPMIVCVAAGEVHCASTVQKIQPYRIPSFSSGNAGPVAWVEEGRVVWTSPGASIQVPSQAPLFSRGHYECLLTTSSPAPSVVWLTSHAGCDAYLIDALLASGCNGVLVAGTGNATLHHALEAALHKAAAAGLPIAVTSRCALGHPVASANAPTPFRLIPLPAAKARLELLMELWAQKTSQ